MISLEEAAALVLEVCEPLPPLQLPRDDLLGCALAEVVHATEDVPPFDSSAMDGYAVQAADTAGADASAPVRLAVLGEMAAGAAPSTEVVEGGAVRIMTGAVVPPGADAIVMVERTARVGDDAVDITHPATVGDHVRHAGDDVVAGDAVLSVGTVLGPAHLGVLASLGVEHALAHPRPRVGVLSTGDELVEGAALAAGQIRESNRPALLASLAREAATPVDLGLVRDDEAAIEAALRAAARTCDVVLTSGGVSMGDYDLVKVVLDRIGDLRWLQIAIKPAKPFALGRLHVDGRSVPVLGLPGNPVSSLVSFELLAAPGLRRAAGHPVDAVHTAPVAATARSAIARRADGKVHFVRVRVEAGDDGALWASPVAGQGSHQLSSMADADALAVLGDGPGIEAGDAVAVLLLRPPRREVVAPAPRP